MNWKFLSIPLLGLAVISCDGKKEEKKADEAAMKAEEHKVAEEPKSAEATPAETPKEEAKKDETKEEPKEEKKSS
jgi:hypothetical protein